MAKATKKTAKKVSKRSSGKAKKTEQVKLALPLPVARLLFDALVADDRVSGPFIDAIVAMVQESMNSAQKAKR
jgi:predicted NAD/FAD-dependent oxidoreductase